MVQDTHTRIEKYCTWKKAQRNPIRSRKRKAPCRMTSKQAENSTSETDIPTGQGFGYPPPIFTDPTHIKTTTHTEGEVKQVRKFLEKYCEFCAKCNEMHCWCNSSDWEEELINVDNSNSNPSVERIPLPTVRKPPVGWSTFRCRVIREKELARPPSSTDSRIGMK